MTPADRIVLDTLRKSARHVDDRTWAAIEALVDVHGIAGLTGAARTVVGTLAADVLKHGSHDQSTHGHGRGGGSTALRVGQTVGVRGMAGRWKVTGSRESKAAGETLYTVLQRGHTREVTVDKITDPPTPTTSAGSAGMASMYGV